MAASMMGGRVSSAIDRFEGRGVPRPAFVAICFVSALGSLKFMMSLLGDNAAAAADVDVLLLLLWLTSAVAFSDAADNSSISGTAHVFVFCLRKKKELDDLKLFHFDELNRQ